MRTSRSGNIATVDDATDIGEGKSKLNNWDHSDNTGSFFYHQVQIQLLELLRLLKKQPVFSIVN